MSNLKLRGIRKAFGNLEVIKGVDLDINSSEFVVFVGPSGCGKSTLLRMIAGLEPITSGELDIGGERMNDVDPSKRGIAMVFQTYALYPHMTVRENMGFALRFAGKPKDEIEKQVKEASRILELDPLLDRLPKQLSGGQRQRVAIARAIATRPALIVLDEAVSALDVSVRERILMLLATLQEERGIAYLFVSHDLAVLRALSHRIAVMEAGRIVECGPAGRVIADPQSPAARALIRAVPRLLPPESKESPDGR